MSKTHPSDEAFVLMPSPAVIGQPSFSIVMDRPKRKPHCSSQAAKRFRGAACLSLLASVAVSSAQGRPLPDVDGLLRQVAKLPLERREPLRLAPFVGAWQALADLHDWHPTDYESRQIAINMARLRSVPWYPELPAVSDERQLWNSGERSGLGNGSRAPASEAAIMGVSLASAHALESYRDWFPGSPKYHWASSAPLGP